ncbi:glycosyltransferase family 4 protein [Treponema sp.]|uniref:glycosyltransferase family 4 protein n=1 Tax=Treponema sp. TaxID=166 RepID=UPI003F03F68A
MKIGIDTFGCEHGKSGLGSYLMYFIKNLPDEPEFSFELFGEEIDRYTYNKEKDVPFSAAGKKNMDARLWHYFSADRFIRKMKYDAVIFPAGARLVPSSFSVPSVAIINDIPAAVLKKESWLAQRHIKTGLSKIDCVVVPSMFVKKNIERSGLKCRRIEIVHNGIDHSSFFPVEPLGIENEIADIKPFAIKKPYIIYASSMQGPEKKHRELIEAFALFKKQTGLPHRLVIAGSDGPCSDDVHRAAFESSAASDIFITGYFPHESFPELYRNSDACIFPSINEGAGLSVLEAMATGVPVACAKAGALPEVAGSNALFFDSDNTAEFASCIEKITTDKTFRKKIIESGLEWTKRFSWEKCVVETMDIIKDILAK